MVALFILVANAVAVQCLGINCEQFDYKVALHLIEVGTLEIIFEIRGFVKIYVKNNKNKRKDE